MIVTSNLPWTGLSREDALDLAALIIITHHASDNEMDRRLRVLEAKAGVRPTTTGPEICNP